MKPRLQDGAERTVQTKPLGFLALGQGARVLELGSSPSILLSRRLCSYVPSFQAWTLQQN